LVDESVTFNEEVLLKGYSQLSRGYDPKYGGFSKAPKFPRYTRIGSVK
jgi:uncharacterized protein YyaL (SSP411 family)